MLVLMPLPVLIRVRSVLHYLKMPVFGGHWPVTLNAALASASPEKLTKLSLRKHWWRFVPAYPSFYVSASN